MKEFIEEVAAAVRDCVDAAATKEVPENLFRRHVGLPAVGELDAAVLELQAEARQWIEQHARPWLALNAHPTEALSFDCEMLATGLEKAQAPLVIAAGMSVGHELEDEVKARWAERPDEAMFLNAAGIALVEHQRACVRDALAEALAEFGLSLLPHTSPGYEGWDLSEAAQSTLLAAVGEPGPIEVLESGGMTPVKSTLALFGTTAVLTEEQRRRIWTRDASEAPPDAPAPFSDRVLEKWSRERLTWEEPEPGRAIAQFRTSGSTCSNLGVPLSMTYRVELRDRSEGLVIEAMSCAASPGDVGYQSSCLFLNEPEEYAAGLLELPPLLGRPLSESRSWTPELCAAGCLCAPANRAHKWRVVLETICHYVGKGV